MAQLDAHATIAPAPGTENDDATLENPPAFLSVSLSSNGKLSAPKEGLTVGLTPRTVKSAEENEVKADAYGTVDVVG